VKLQSALALAGSGFRVFPLSPNSKVPPKEFPWKDEATTDEAKIRQWWEENPKYNIGVAAGHGLLVVDADCKNGKPGMQSLELLDMLGMPESLRVYTPSGGVHVYLKSDEDFQNRVDSLPDYPGIDIRSAGGYVVGPGSTLNGKAYEAKGTTVAAAPDWWKQHLKETTPKHIPHSDTPLVELDRPEHILKAVDYLLNTAPEAIEGSGGDETTYKVAAHLRDLGISEGKAFDLMVNMWNDTKASPPWDYDDLRTKVENAYQYATGGWGAKTALGEFGDVSGIAGDQGPPPQHIPDEAKPKTAKSPSKLHFLTYDEMLNLPEPEWLIDGVIQRNSAALMFGKSNSFKSFLAIDLGLSVATGRPWHGNQTKQGRVLFVATEGANGVGRLRIPGWLEHYSIPAELRANVFLYPQEICLDDKEQVKALIAACQAIGGFELIVLDIFGGTMMGSETEDTTARTWVHNIQALMRATGAATLTVAHTGWQDDTRARMHTHFWGSFDTRMKVEGDKEKMTTLLMIERHKDADSHGHWGFNLESVERTLVPVYDPEAKAEGNVSWPESLRTAAAALDMAISEHGVLKFGDEWPACKVVEIRIWREFCYNLGLSKSDDPGTQARAFRRAREQLLGKKAVEIYEDFVWPTFDSKG